MNRLTRIDLRGFKTIQKLDHFEFGSLNVLIGANGAGKSNFISFFRLLSAMVASPGGLQLYVGKSGGANALLHDGAAVTPEIEARLEFESDSGISEYSLQLVHAAPDTLIFAEERFRHTGNQDPDAAWQVLGAGHREARIVEAAETGNEAARTIRDLLRECVVYQFHNTSETARIRQARYVGDGKILREDAGNLASFLWSLQRHSPAAYRRIVEVIRQILPFFADFDLGRPAGKPTDFTLVLEWRERNSDLLFGPHQASDGMLRSMALIALLLQPIENVPAVVILDEPELGLHPVAISVVAGLIQSLSLQRQIILATQSMTLIDYFEPEDIIVVDRADRVSTFRHLQAELLREWLEEYSLAELWEKNVLGGRPSA